MTVRKKIITLGLVVAMVMSLVACGKSNNKTETALITASIAALIPVLVCILTAFKTDEKYRGTSVLTAPQSFLYFENFKIALEKANMVQGFSNTGMVLIVVLTASIFIGSILAYVLNRSIQGQCGCSEPVYVCSSDSWNCNAGYGISDYAHLRIYQSSVWIHGGYDGNGYYLDIHFPAVF